MSETFLHGVEVIQVDDGIRPIQTVRSSVIGVVGTAPNSAPEVKATAATGFASSNNALTWTSKLYGALGNDISVHLQNPNANSAALEITVSGRAIVVRLATGATGIVTTTAEELLTAIAAKQEAAALVDVANTGTSDGSGVLTTSFRAVSMTGGSDEPFPLNKPVLVAGNQREAARLGAAGTLPEAMTGIFRQTGAVVVVIRVEEGADENESLQNIVGGVDVDSGSYTGAWAFLGSESAIGFCPRILIAPGWTHQRPEEKANPVAVELEAIASRLRAVVVKDGTNTTDAAAIQDRQYFGSKRVYIVDPFVTIMRDGDIVNVPASSYAAGLIARVDNDMGFWNSPSNKEIFGIVGLARSVDFVLGDTNSRANLLNEQEVTTIIRQEGFRLWGNRTTSADQKWAFLSRVRTADMINESILRNHLWAVDRGITRQYFEDVAAGVNAYLRRLTSIGAITGGICWADPELNTKENIFAGRAVFCFEFSDTPPAERVTFRSMLTDRFLEEIV